MKLLRKLLILSHRYLGIAISLLVMMWFSTGIVMMYAGGMPRLTPELRLERMPALDLSRVQLTPADAIARAELSFPPDRVALSTIMERPAYRLAVGRTMTVFADTGEVLDEVTLAQARTMDLGALVRRRHGLRRGGRRALHGAALSSHGRSATAT